MKKRTIVYGFGGIWIFHVKVYIGHYTQMGLEIWGNLWTSQIMQKEVIWIGFK